MLQKAWDKTTKKGNLNEKGITQIKKLIQRSLLLLLQMLWLRRVRLLQIKG